MESNFQPEPIVNYEKQSFVYIITNTYNTTLYTGVTNNLQRRVGEHKEGKINGFAKKYNANKLVYYEVFRDIQSAIAREKQIKGYSRKKKLALIETLNQTWRDLYFDLA
jgi:putative endonuclease